MTTETSVARPPLTILSDEEAMFRDAVAGFAEDEVRPRVQKMEREGKIDPELIRKFFEMGLMGVEVPESLGGSDGSLMMIAVAVEEISKIDPAAAILMDVQNTLVNNALLRWTNDEQKRRYLPQMCGNTVGAYALSEAGSGSDAFALATRAIDTGAAGGEYRLTGRKLWITNAAEASLFLVFATVNPEAGYKGITAFLIERDFPGFAVGKKEDKLGIRASSTCELILDDCRVPKANVIGQVGQGYKIAIETLNQGRIGIGAQMTGLAEGALGHALDYARQRKQFGKPIAEFQGVQFELAEMAVEVEAARLMVYNAARLKDAGRPYLMEAAMCKYYASQVAERVASRAVEVLGGVGFTKDYPVEKLYRDAKIGRIYEGTSNIQLVTIAKQLLGGKA